jgi:hypothetical protein
MDDIVKEFSIVEMEKLWKGEVNNWHIEHYCLNY